MNYFTSSGEIIPGCLLFLFVQLVVDICLLLRCRLFLFIFKFIYLNSYDLPCFLLLFIFIFYFFLVQAKKFALLFSSNTSSKFLLINLYVKFFPQLSSSFVVFNLLSRMTITLQGRYPLLWSSCIL